MRHKIISLTQAKAKLLQLARGLDENGEAYLLTKDGTPIGALVPIEDYEALLETADVLADPQTLTALEKALADERQGRLWKRDKQGRWIKARARTPARSARRKSPVSRTAPAPSSV